MDEENIKPIELINKIWNASRFVLSNIEDFRLNRPEDKWILTKYEETLQEVQKFMEDNIHTICMELFVIIT